MKKRDKSLDELIAVCSEMLEVSRKYGYLWEEDDIWKLGKGISVAHGFIAQDETFNIYIAKRGDKYVFAGRNFCEGHEGYDAAEAALTIKDYFSTYNRMGTDNLRENFYNSLTDVLGKHLAKEELKKIKF
jgi:hypothetical protein